MAFEDARDRLLDALLQEALGREALPDLTERICQRAFAPRVEPFPWGLAAAAVAALLLLAAMGYMALRPAPPNVAQTPEPRKEQPKPEVARKPEQPPAPAYPEPRASGEFIVEDGGGVRRGATLKTANGKADVHLGGYCALKLDPHSRLQIKGAEHKEEVFLQQGGVSCNVVKAQGTFDVRTEMGTVSVKGTQFIVQIVHGEGDAKMTKQMWVKVVTGSVLLIGAWGQQVLAEGDHRKVPEARDGPRGTVGTGVVTAKGEGWIEIQREGYKEATRFVPGLSKEAGGPDKAIVNVIAEAPVQSVVKFEWRKEEGQLRLLRLMLVRRGAGEGEARKPEGKPEGGVGEHAAEGDKPKEHHGEGDAPKPDARPVQTGSVVGVVTGKAENSNWIAVKTDGAAEPEKYIPRWIGGMPADGGGPDRLMLKTFAGLKVGDRVKIEWLRDEHLRAVKIEPADAPK